MLASDELPRFAVSARQVISLRRDALDIIKRTMYTEAVQSNQDELKYYQDKQEEARCVVLIF